jgi:DNA primase small subunit
LYPRLDANVSKAMNHLLKSPFCVHPKTGKICVPFEPERVKEFDVNNVPTLTKVIADSGCMFNALRIFKDFTKKYEEKSNKQV